MIFRYSIILGAITSCDAGYCDSDSTICYRHTSDSIRDVSILQYNMQLHAFYFYHVLRVFCQSTSPSIQRIFLSVLFRALSDSLLSVHARCLSFSCVETTNSFTRSFCIFYFPFLFRLHFL